MKSSEEMKTFQDFILECSQVDESSLSRLKSKHDKGGVAVLSGSRGDKSNKENRERAKSLDKDIRSKFGKGATKVTGKYTEKDDKSGKETKVKERSHVVTSGKMGKKKFKKEVKKLGKKYTQDSVLTQTKKTATLHRTRKGGLEKKGENVGRFKPQGKNPYGQSQIKGKTFSYGD